MSELTPRQQAEEIKIRMTQGSWNDALDILEALIKEKSCPHIRGDGESMYCDLAETAVKALEARLARAHNAMQVAEDQALAVAAELDEATARAEAAEAENARLAAEITRLQESAESWRDAHERGADMAGQETATLKAEVERLRGALDRVEWVGNPEHGDAVCPWCNMAKQYGHKLDCARQSALEGGKGE